MRCGWRGWTATNAKKIEVEDGNGARQPAPGRVLMTTRWSMEGEVIRWRAMMMERGYLLMSIIIIMMA